MNSEILVNEIKRRTMLTQAVDLIIQHLFIPKEKCRLRRGMVQEQILRELKLKKNNRLCKLINERMKLQGFEAAIIRGDQYYKNISHRI